MNLVPHGVKYNNRYRGPHESIKANSTYVQTKYNINKLKKKLEYIEKRKDDIIEKPDDINKMTSSICTLTTAIEDTIEKILNYEVKHSE